jgi:hypothetical protein
MAVQGLTVIGRAFGIWPATLQVMPGGILDAGFRRLFVGVPLKNDSTQAWPATEVRLSARGRQVLAAAGVSVSDGWSLGDAAAVGQNAPTEWISVPALAAKASQLVFFKMDVTGASVGQHAVEIELRDPAAPQTTLKTNFRLLIARTACEGSERSFVSTTDHGTLTASLSAVTMDQEVFRRVLTRTRAIAGVPAPGVRTPAETERLRLRLKALLCGEESDVCGVLADLNTSCALPTGSPPGPPPASGMSSLTIFSTQATTLANSVRIADGAVGSNGPVTIGNDGIVNGNVTAGGDVQIGDRTVVQGDVTTAGVIRRTQTGGSVIGGTARERASYTALTIPTKTVTPGTTAVTVPNDHPGQTIAPGSYAVVTLRARAKVTFNPGVYHMAQLIIEPDVTLTLNQATGPIDVRVRDNLSFGDRVIIKSEATTAPGAIASFYSSQTSEVRVGTDIVHLPVALVAPQGTIHVFSRTNISGSIQAKTVILEPDIGAARVPVDAWLGTGASGLEFFGYPTGLSYSVSYANGYFGTTGPLAFDSTPWRDVLANALLAFDLGLPGAVAAELFTLASHAVIGNVKTSVLNAPTSPPTSPPPTQAGSVDASVAKVTARRALGFPQFSYLDASPGEANATPIASLGGSFASSGPFLTNTEISDIFANPGPQQIKLKVHKSGAGTGVTRGLLSALVPVLARDEATNTLHFVNQIVIVSDPSAPPADGKVASMGDSGALWIHTDSGRLLGLSHTVGTGGAAVASRIEDVVNALQIHF